MLRSWTRPAGFASEHLPRRSGGRPPGVPGLAERLSQREGRGAGRCCRRAPAAAARALPAAEPGAGVRPWTVLRASEERVGCGASGRCGCSRGIYCPPCGGYRPSARGDPAGVFWGGRSRCRRDRGLVAAAGPAGRARGSAPGEGRYGLLPKRVFKDKTYATMNGLKVFKTPGYISS